MSKEEYTISSIKTYEELMKYLIYYNNYFEPTLVDMVDSLQEYCRKIHNKANVVEIKNKENKQLGMIAFYANDKINKIGYITLVVVDKEYYGRGIGTRLMQYCEEYCAKCGMKKILLEVNKNNMKAINLYKKMGFEEIDQYKKINSIYMEKDIS